MILRFWTQETEYKSLGFDLFTFLGIITHFQFNKVIGNSKLHNKFSSPESVLQV